MITDVLRDSEFTSVSPCAKVSKLEVTVTAVQTETGKPTPDASAMLASYEAHLQQHDK